MKIIVYNNYIILLCIIVYDGNNDSTNDCKTVVRNYNHDNVAEDV